MDVHLTTDSCELQQLIVGDWVNNLQPMVVMSKQSARDDFAGRLNECLAAHDLAPKDRGKNAWLARAMSVSSEMARKWLAGEALPNQARMAGIAEFFSVRVAWLRDGEGTRNAAESKAVRADNDAPRMVTAYGVTVTEDGLLFAAEWEKLTSDERLAIEELVGVMVGKKVRDSRKRKPAPAGDQPPSPSARLTKS